MSEYITNTTCRICKGTDLVRVLDLGTMPPANSFLSKEDVAKPEKQFPLIVYFCNTCSLLQLLDVVNPEILFGNYDYLTSASKPLVDHFTNSARTLADRFGVEQNDLVVEIGGNDGVLLSAIKERARILNIEPAKNVAELSIANGIPTLNAFFSAEIANMVLRTYGPAKLVVANNVMAHIDDLHDVIKGVASLIKEHGTFVFEAHWVGNLIGEGGFDQIYHEHVCYFSLNALKHLMGQFGLTIFDVEMLPIHGASLRIFVGKEKTATPRVDALRLEEEKLGLHKADTFLKFKDKVEHNRGTLVATLASLKKEGKHIIGYGAPAKGNTLLNFCGIKSDVLDFVIDTTPLKQGRLMPGSHIPVEKPEKMQEAAPDYVLLLAWNYADAIIKKEQTYLAGGGKFIIPVPEPKIIES